MLRATTYRAALSPAVRGAAFYGAHFAAFGAVLPFLNVYWDQIGLSGRQIGVLAAIGPALNLLVAPSIAAFADRRRQRVVMLTVTTLVSALLFGLFGVSQRFAWLLLVMLLFTAVRSPVMPLCDGLIARMATRYGLNFGSMRLWGSIGFSIVAIISGYFWREVGYGALFVVGTIVLLPTAFFAWLLEEGAPRVVPTAPPASPRLLLRDRGFVVLLVATFLTGVGLGMGITYEGIYMSQLGGSELFIGLLLGLGAAWEIPIMQYSERIRRRLGSIPTLLLAYCAFGLAYLGYAAATAVWMPLLFSVAKGVGIGLIITTTVRVVDDWVPEAWAATAQSLATASLWGLSILVASLLGGAVLDFWGVRYVFVVGSVSSFLAALLIGIARRRGILAVA